MNSDFPVDQTESSLRAGMRRADAPLVILPILLGR